MGILSLDSPMNIGFVREFVVSQLSTYSHLTKPKTFATCQVIRIAKDKILFKGVHPVFIFFVIKSLSIVQDNRRMFLKIDLGKSGKILNGILNQLRKCLWDINRRLQEPA